MDILDMPPLGSEPPQEQPILTFENRRYDLNGLSDEIKELVHGLQVADAQIRLQEDNRLFVNESASVVGGPPGRASCR